MIPPTITPSNPKAVGRRIERQFTTTRVVFWDAVLNGFLSLREYGKPV
jgi:hypothetical protein